MSLHSQTAVEDTLGAQQRPKKPTHGAQRLIPTPPAGPLPPAIRQQRQAPAHGAIGSSPQSTRGPSAAHICFVARSPRAATPNTSSTNRRIRQKAIPFPPLSNLSSRVCNDWKIQNNDESAWKRASEQSRPCWGPLHTSVPPAAPQHPPGAPTWGLRGSRLVEINASACAGLDAEATSN